MTVALFISPHFDDVVFSCPLAVMRSVARGERVVIATLFSATGDGSIQPERAADDATACRHLGATPCALGLADAPWRDALGARDTIERVLLTPLGQETTELHHASTALQTLCDALQPQALYAPLGIGAHIDHRIAHRAALALTTAAGRWFYADQPYARMRGATALRMRQIGIESRVDEAAFVTHFVNELFIVGVCPDARRRDEIARGLLAQATEAVRLHRTQVWQSVELAATPAEAELATTAIRAYRSEAEQFIGAHFHDSEVLWTAT